MLAISESPGLNATSIEHAVLDQLPEAVFGHDNWSSTVTRVLVRHLLDAVDSGRGDLFVNAIRTVTHVPSTRDVRTIANAVCDAASTYATINRGASEQVLRRVSLLRKGVNEILDQSQENVPDRSTSATAVSAYQTVLQLVGVSRPDLRKHLEATSSLSIKIARQLDLPAASVEAARLGGLLHDIGLLTTGTDPALAERDPGHMILAERCLSGIEPLRELAPIVRAHHERFDGGGQPDGLRGAEIPIEARIIGVADAFEHLVNRPGRSNPIAAAISELWQESGKAYDPDVVAAVTRIFNQHWRVHRTATGSP